MSIGPVDSSRNCEPELHAPAPRTVRPRFRILLWTLPVLFCFGIGAAVVSGIRIWSRAAEQDLQALRDQGQVTTGRTTHVTGNRNRGGSTTLWIHYEFQAAGKTYRGRYAGFPTEMHDVEVTFLPSNPDVFELTHQIESALKSKVELRRAITGIGVGITLLLCLFSGLAAAGELNRLRRLAVGGVATVGAVTRVLEGGAEYSFRAPGVGVQTGTDRLTEKQRTMLQPQMSTTILYDPVRPDRHCMYLAVRKAFRVIAAEG